MKDDIRKYLEVIKRSVKLIENIVNEGCVCPRVEDYIKAWECPIHGAMTRANSISFNDDSLLEIKVEPSEKEVEVGSDIPLVAPSPEAIAFKKVREKHIKDLFAIDCWPPSVPPHLVEIELTPETRTLRANAALDLMLKRSLKNKNFLDFGCGDGSIAAQAIHKGVTEAWGYDIKSDDYWESLEEIENLKLTNDYKDISSTKFDVIFLWDVLDHCEDPEGVMKQVYHLLDDEGIVYVRCHPWLSRSGAHLHTQGLNKAFMHLFLNWEELAEEGYKAPYVRTELKPLEAYGWWFNEFTIYKCRKIQVPLSPFFFEPSFKQLLGTEHELDEEGVEDLLELMQINFVDYFLVKSDEA